MLIFVFHQHINWNNKTNCWAFNSIINSSQHSHSLQRSLINMRYIDKPPTILHLFVTLLPTRSLATRVPIRSHERLSYCYSVILILFFDPFPWCIPNSNGFVSNCLMFPFLLSCRKWFKPQIRLFFGFNVDCCEFV